MSTNIDNINLQPQQEREAEIVKQNEQHDDAAHFGINSQNYNFFSAGLSMDIL